MALKVIEDMSYILLLRKKFSYIESIPGVLLPHPSSSSSSSPSYPFKLDPYGAAQPEPWHHLQPNLSNSPEFYDHFGNHQPMMRITPSMSSLEALLSKLPSVVPAAAPPSPPPPLLAQHFGSSSRAVELMGIEKVAKEEVDDDQEPYLHEKNGGESSGISGPSSYHYQYHHHFNQNHYHGVNVTSSSTHNSGF